jgi:hypothetical protein
MQRGNWGKVLDIIRRSLDLGSQAYTLFSSGLVSEVAIFALFQCFSIFQHSRLLIYVCVCVCVCVCVRERERERERMLPVFCLLPAGQGQHGGLLSLKTL